MKTILTILLVIAVKIAFCQYPNILISDLMPNEPSIYIDPHNTNSIIAGANIDNYYISQDGGLTWTSNILTSDLGVWGDPCMIIDTAGNFYFFHLSYPSNDQWIDRIVCQKSENKGQAWNNGAGIYVDNPKQQDKEWAVVNPFNNEIYVTWTQFDEYGTTNPLKRSNILFSKSSDEGETWSNAIRINEIDGNCFDGDSTVEGAVPATGPDGEIYVSWAGPAGIVFDRSLDGGNTWLDHDIFVSDFPGGWDYSIPGISRCNGLPVTCCDLSQSPYRGNIYINWSDQRNGATDTDIWLAKSTDGGLTWSAPKRINDDSSGKQQFMSWMTVDQANGTIWIVFYDRRNYDNNQTDVYLAYSEDGGESFTNIKISESPFIPSVSLFFGDYTNISAFNNIVRPIWCRLSNGKTSIFTAIMDPLFTKLQDQPDAPFSIESPYPNPFTETAVLCFELEKQTKISLNIYDSFGKKVYTVFDNKTMRPGENTQTFDRYKMNLKPGLYFYKLTGEEIDRTGKFIIN